MLQVTISVINDHFKDDGWFGPMKVESKLEGEAPYIVRTAWKVAYRMHRMNRSMRIQVTFGDKPAYMSNNRHNFWWHADSTILWSHKRTPATASIGCKIARSEAKAVRS